MITDTHWGIRNDQQALLDNNKRFLDDVFFPYLKEHKISTVIHLGDLVDKRKSINFNTAQRLRTDFIEPLYQGDFDFHWILGNHDVYYRETLEVNAAAELFSQYQNDYGFSFYIEPTEVKFDNTPILFLPWICEATEAKTVRAIEETKCQIAFAHLELAGFEQYKGIIAQHGHHPNSFKKFDIVCSGHYHQKSSLGNINYLGAHAEFIWSDYNCDRGFHIFDTATRDLRFVPNPHCMFRKAFYDDSTDAYKKTDFSQLTDRFVKVIVTNKSNQLAYDWFLGKVDEARPLDYVVVDDHLNLDLVNDSDIVSETKDTLTIIREYVSVVNVNGNEAVALDNLLVDLYQQAQSME